MSAKRKKAVVEGGGQVRPLTVSKPELLSDNSDTVFRRLVHDMLAVAARVQEIRNGLGAHIGLTGSQYTILITIDHNQDRAEGIGVNQVAEHLHLSGAFVTLEVNKLVEKGLVDKTVNPTDRRRVQLCTTNAAQRLLIRLTTLQQPVNNALFGSLSHAEFLTLGDLMAKMIVSSDRSAKLLKYLTHADEAPPRQLA
jgi:MarR family transcriptional regulator, organic hydroperoxide resistance regulator